jgi:hypothetical protein
MTSGTAAPSRRRFDRDRDVTGQTRVVPGACFVEGPVEDLRSSVTKHDTEASDQPRSV